LEHLNSKNDWIELGISKFGDLRKCRAAQKALKPNKGDKKGAKDDDYEQ